MMHLIWVLDSVTKDSILLYEQTSLQTLDRPSTLPRSRSRAVVLNVKQNKLTNLSGSESRLLYELSNYLSWCGLSDPEHQVRVLCV